MYEYISLNNFYNKENIKMSKPTTIKITFIDHKLN